MVKKDYERIGVKISIAGSLLLALSAIVMALIAESQAILLDGLYTVITLVMAFISLKVIDLIEAPESSSRPFGYMSLEPFLNFAKSLVILALMLVFLITNIQVLTTGGRIIALDMTMLYILICLVIYAFIIFFLRRYRNKTKSSILALETKTWYIDALLTVGIAVSLAIAMVLYRMGYTKILPYIDPTIVILLVVLSLPVPLKIFVIEIKRLLLLSPENDIQAEVTNQLQDLIAKHGLVNTRVWGLKGGRTYYLFIYWSLKEDGTTIGHLDGIRAEVFKELSKLYEKFWADIIFTAIDPETSYTDVMKL